MLGGLRPWAELLLAVALLTVPSAMAQPDRLVIGAAADAVTLDPRFAGDIWSTQRLSAIMEPLIQLDDRLELQPRLATAWELAEDLMSVTFHLRRGVSFHDGRPFGSADVRYTFETILDPELDSWNRARLQDIVEIETPDEHTVVFRLGRPYGFILNRIADSPIVPAGADPTFGEHPIGTGPYRFLSQQRDDRMLLVRNDDYWGGAGPIATIEFRTIPDNSVRLLAFEAGELDMIQGQLPPIELARLADDPRFGMERAPGSAYLYLGFNTRVPPFHEPLVRQALNHLIPREAIVANVYNGAAIPALSMLLPAGRWSDPAMRSFAYDPDLAVELVRQAGVSFDRPVTLLVAEDSVRQLMAEIIAFEFSRVGLEVRLEVLEEIASIERVFDTDDYELFIMGWAGVLDPDVGTVRQFHSGELGTLNRTFFADPRLDELLELGARTDPTTQASIDIYREAVGIIVEASPYAFLVHIEEVALFWENVQGWRVHPDMGRAFQDLHLISKVD